MTGGGGLSRRAILRLLGWSGLFTLSGQLARAAQPTSASRSEIQLYARPESAAAVGAAFIRLHPDEAEPAALLRLLELPARTGSLASSVIESQHLVRLRQRVRRDFREGQVTKLRGWTLALTELRLCALVHLSRKQ